MAPRPPVALVAGVVACALLAACSQAGPSAAGAPATRAEYIAAVEALMDPPGQLASAISERTHTGTPAPAQGRLDTLVATAEERLTEFRLMRLDDGPVRRQRDRIARAYDRLIPPMRTAVTSLEAASGAPVATAVDPFLLSLKELPSAASPSSR
jgi:hypothetical protein